MYSALWKKNGEQIRPSFISVNANVVDLAAQIVFTKTYSNVGANFSNSGNNNNEATFKAHLNTSIGVLTGFEIKLDGKVTSAEVVNQAEAMKQFESNQSNTNIVKEADFNDPFIQEDFFLCKLSNLAQYNELEIIITYVTEMSMQGDYLYMVFPTSLSTVRATQHVESLPLPSSLPNTHNNSATKINTSTDQTEQRQGLLIKLDLEMPSSIEDVKSPSHPEGIEAKWNESAGQVIYKDTRPVDVVNQSDLVILVKLSNPHEPTGFAERNEDGSRAVMVVFFPKLEQAKKQAQQEMELIFLVDCSESMQGYNIAHAKKGLLLFSHSLAKGTYFNIISFGSSYQKLFPQSVPYGEENLAAANTYIKSLKAESGTETNLLAALQDIYKTPATRPRKIFLVTDGRVNNTGQIAELVRQNAHNTSVFPIGMGDFVSRQLVDAIASAGCGVAELAVENETIENKVMRQLKRALQPAYTNIRIDWGSISSLKQSPRDLRTLFDGDRLTVFNILSEGEKVPDSGTVKLLANGPNGPVSFHVNIKGNEIKRGNLVHCLAAYTLILDLEQQLQECSDAVEAERLKKRIIDLGVKYSLGTNYTSFISLEDPTLANSTDGTSRANGVPLQSQTQVPTTIVTNPAVANLLNQSSGSIHHYPESAMISLRGSASGIPTNLSGSSSTIHHHAINNVSPSRTINTLPPTTTSAATAPVQSTTPIKLNSSSPPFTPSTLSSASAPFTPGSAFAKSNLKLNSPEFVPKSMGGGGFGAASTIPFAINNSTPLKPTAQTFTPSKPVVVPTTPVKAEEPVVTPVVSTPVKVESVPAKVEEKKVEPAVVTPVKAEEKKVEPVAPVEEKKVEPVAPVEEKKVEPAVVVPVKVEEKKVETPVVSTPVKETPSSAPSSGAATPAAAAQVTPKVVQVATTTSAAGAAPANSVSPPAKRQYTHDYLMSLKDLPSNTIIPEKLKQHAGILNINPNRSSGIFKKEGERRGGSRHDRNSQPIPAPKKIFSKDTQGEYGEIYKKFKFNLNRITMDTYATLVKAIEEIPIANEEVLSGVAKILFEKAIIDQKYSAVFAILTGHLDSKFPKFDNNKLHLKREVITNCQKEFELHLTDTYDRSKHDTMSQEDREEAEFIIKRRYLGNIKFIGELYKHSVLAESIVLNYCIAKLLEKATTSYPEDTIEGMAKFISTIGKKLDADPSKPGLNGVFNQIRMLSENDKLTSRGRYLLLDLLDLRTGRWEPKNNTISKVNKEENDKEEKFIAKHGGRGGGNDRRDRDRRDDRDDRRDRRDRDDRRDRRDDRDDRRDRDSSKGGIFGKANKDGWETVKGSPKGKQTPKKGDLSNSRDNVSNSPSTKSTPPRGVVNQPILGKKKEEVRQNAFAVLDDDDYDMPTSPKKPTPKQEKPATKETTSTTTTPSKSQTNTPSKSESKLPTMEKLEADVSMTLDEYLESSDADEALECIKELNYPTLYSKIICIIVNKSFEKNNREKTSIVEFFNVIIMSQIFSSDNFKDGFKEVLDSIEDIEIDLPFASKFLAELIGFCIEAEVLSLNFLEENYVHLVDSGKAEEMLKETFDAIITHGDSEERLAEIYEKTSNLDILKLFRPKNRTTQYLQEFFQENFPVLSSVDRVVSSDSEPTLVEHLILLQKAEGYFELTKQLAGVLNIPLSDIEKVENSDSLAITHPKIWATALAYSYILTNFTEEQDDLELINQKISSWLNSEFENTDAPKISLDDTLKKAKRFISEY